MGGKKQESLEERVCYKIIKYKVCKKKTKKNMKQDLECGIYLENTEETLH